MRLATWTGSVSVLDRLSAVLDAFDGADNGLTIGEISERANLPKSTVSRIAGDLVNQGYLDREGAFLYLGIRLFELGQGVEHPRRLRDLTRRGMLQLRNATGLHVQLAVKDGDEVVVIASMPGRQTPAHPATIGDRFPVTATVLGAASDADSLEPAVLPAVGDNFPAVYSRAHERTLCLASEVTDRREVWAALSVCGAEGVVDPVEVAPLVQRAAAALSQALTA